jgi:hypothetical protein
MRKTEIKIEQSDDGMLDHYELDYSKAKQNRFAPILAEQEGFVKLNENVRSVFKTSEEVNNVLQAIISNYPIKSKRGAKTV